MMSQMSKRWYDAGSHSIAMTEVTYSSSASIQMDQAIIALAFERDSQDAKRVEDFDIQRLRLVMDRECAKHMVQVLNEHIAALNFYDTHDRWPMGHEFATLTA